MQTGNVHQLMIVDDSEFMRRFLSKFLGKKLELTLVSDGVEALQKLQTGYRPAAILADINMPNMNGFEFLEHLQDSHYSNQSQSSCCQAMTTLMTVSNPSDLELSITS